jgi:two-component system response regulator HydG
VRDGLFREDLYYRLNVLPIEMPALKDRAEDIPMLVTHFTKRFVEANKQLMPTIEPELLVRMRQMPWPGNVRELENTLIRMLTLRHLPAALTLEDWDGENHGGNGMESALSLAGMTLAEIEKLALVQTLELCGQRKAEVARMLGVAEKSIYNKIKRHGID